MFIHFVVFIHELFDVLSGNLPPQTAITTFKHVKIHMHTHYSTTDCYSQFQTFACWGEARPSDINLSMILSCFELL